MLIENTVDKVTLVQELLPLFKQHLRIIDDFEDDAIAMYLEASIDSIEDYAGNDIFAREWTYALAITDDEFSKINIDLENNGFWFDNWGELAFMNIGKNGVRLVQVFDDADVDITKNYTIDYTRGMIAPHPYTNKMKFETGYVDSIQLPAKLKMIIMRYGAELYENREVTAKGNPIYYPDWLSFALAGLWKPRI